MSIEARDVLSRYNGLVAEKSAKRQLMNQINEFFSPDDGTYTGETLVGISANEKGELLDTTASDLINEYVSHTFGIFYDLERRWFSQRIVGHHDNPDLRRILEIRSDILYHAIGRTNYYSQCTLHEWDVSVHGHGVMTIESDKENFASCLALNPREINFDMDGHSRVTDILWAETYSWNALVRMFPEVTQKLQIRGVNIGDLSRINSHRVINYYFKVNENTLTPEEYAKYKGFKYVRKYYFDLTGYSSKDSDDNVIDLGKEDMWKYPVIFPARDVPTREHAYGEGVGKIVLPKARILNSLKRSMLNLAKLKASPPLIVTSDFAQNVGLLKKTNQRHGITNNRDLLGSSIYITDLDDVGDLGGARRFPIETLDVAGKLDEMLALYQDTREQTAELLPIPGQVYKVARQSIDEISQRTEQQLKRLAPIRANYVQEALTMHLQRFNQLAETAGLFKDVPLPDDVNENDVKFVFDAFLMQLKSISDSIRLTRAFSIVAPVFQAKPSMIDKLNGDKIMNEVFGAHGVMKMLLSEEATQGIREAAQQQQQQQQQLQQQEITGNILKNAVAGIQAGSQTL